MNYKQLTKEKKAQIDVLLDQGLSMRKTAEALGISHSTISRYKSGLYTKRKIDINNKNLKNTFLDLNSFKPSIRSIYIKQKIIIFAIDVGDSSALTQC